MKKLSTVLVLCSIVFLNVNGQISSQKDTLKINNIAALVNSNGLLFYDSLTGSGVFEILSDSGTDAAFVSNLWVGGYEVGNSQFHYASDMWGNEYAFFEGPVANNYNSTGYSKFRRLWKINKSTVDNHRLNYNSSGYIMDPIIADWPAHGDTNNGEAYNLAPFIDVNYNKIYDPQNGDFPCIKGDQAIYLIFNSKTGRGNCNLDLEIHMMIYAYSNQTALESTVFIEQKVINRSNYTLSDLLVGRFIDMDLGGIDDDFSGCDTNLNLNYVYNGDGFDGPNNGSGGFGNNPGAVGLAQLNTKPHVMMAMYRQGSGGIPAYMTHPQFALQYYNYMDGIWKNGSHMVVGGNGSPQDPKATSQLTNFMFPGDPLDTNTWTQVKWGMTPGDPNSITSTKYDTFAPNDYLQLDYAVIYARDTTKNNLENVAVLKSAATKVKAFYDSTTTWCPYFATGIEDEQVKPSFLVFPNPASSTINFNITGGLMEQLEIFNNVGAKVEFKSGINATTLALDVSDLTDGVYVARISVDGKLVTHRFIINK